MKKISLTIILVLIFSGSILTLANAANNSNYSESLLDESTDVLSLTPEKTLLVDKVNSQIQVLDLSLNKVVWSKKFPVIYDSQVLQNPIKIILITTERNKLKKVTLSSDGSVISEQIYSNIKLTEDLKVSWSPKVGQNKETIMMASNGKINMYQYPWKKPFVTLSYVMPEDKAYEVTTLKDIKLQSGYAVIKINGNNSTQDQDFYRVINLSSMKKFTIPVEWNITSHFVIEAKELVVITSSQIGNPLGIDTSTKHTIYTRYDLATGTENTSVTRSYALLDSNWSSSYLSRQLTLIDSEQNKLTVFDQKGNVINETSLTVSNKELRGKLVGYYKGKLYMLALGEDGHVELIETSMK